VTEEQFGKNREKLRKVYGDIDGRTALADLLNDLGLFEVDNQAKVILMKLGIWQEHNMMNIVNALMDMPYAKKIKKGED